MMTFSAWVLTIWLCGPDRAGTCRPAPEAWFATRAECMRARRAQWALPDRRAYCSLVRADDSGWSG